MPQTPDILVSAAGPNAVTPLVRLRTLREAVREARQPAGDRYAVEPYAEGGWAVSRTSALRILKRFDDRDRAVKWALGRPGPALAVYVYREDGRLEKVMLKDSRGTRPATDDELEAM